MSIRHLELAVIDIAVGQGEGDDITPRAGDVNDHAVGRGSRLGLHLAATCQRNLNRHLAEVFKKDDGKRVAVNGGINGRCFGDALGLGYFNNNGAKAIN